MRKRLLLGPALILGLLAVQACSDNRPASPTSPSASAGATPRLRLLACCRDSVVTSISAFDPLATIAPTGRGIQLAGPIECTPAGQRGQFRATVSQAATGATAFGLFTVTCTGSPGRWSAAAQLVGPTAFAAGAALACAELTPAFDQRAGREHWCRQIELVH